MIEELVFCPTVTGFMIGSRSDYHDCLKTRKYNRCVPRRCGDEPDGRVMKLPELHNSNNKRKSVRYRMNKPVICTELSQIGGQLDCFSGEMVDISDDGVKLRSGKPPAFSRQSYPAQGNVKFAVHFNGVRVGKGKVHLNMAPVWCFKDKESNQFEMGLRWKDLSLPKKLLIKHWQHHYAEPVATE